MIKGVDYVICAQWTELAEEDRALEEDERKEEGGKFLSFLASLMNNPMAYCADNAVLMAHQTRIPSKHVTNGRSYYYGNKWEETLIIRDLEFLFPFPILQSGSNSSP
ncbi:hypothetical protein PKNA1_C2_0117850 [Plasmodium knowlesi strain H]|uniref:Uncharacterized protein n=1 Tax=Plasmodium knowlesi (strain H) TaxID=5851 RepID=A0A1A7W0M7_PLAKH|nr:hypothetical protein PKNA1_C2_0117850 [Plasmodium knowlesi strain H]SBO27746.1 hypothetical protein PKNA1_H1_0117850 [Plasmodium knowlesi strain H]